MKKWKEKSEFQFMKALNYYSRSKKTFKSGMLFGFGILLMVVGLFMFNGISHKSKEVTFDDLRTSSSLGLNQIESAKKNKINITVFLYRSDCGECKAIESKFAPALNKAMSESRSATKPRDFVVLDTNKLSEKQRKRLLNDMDDLMSKPVTVPLLLNTKAELSKDKKSVEYHTIGYNDTTKLDDLQKILKQSHDK